MPRPRPVLLLSAVGAALGALGAAACDARPIPANLLVAALSSDPGHLNPAITTQGGVHTAAALLFDGLIALDDDLQPVPALATRWVVEDGGATYRFTLRPGVRWHDGRPFSSADVKFSFDSVLLRFHSRTRASLGAALDRIDTPNESTVVFRFREPYAALLQQLDVVEAPMIPRHLFANSDPTSNAANRAPVGTGPFRFVSYRPDEELQYVANAEYFGGKPAIDRIVMRIIPDGGMQVLALESGEVDWLFGVPGPDRARVARSPGLGTVQTTVNPGGSNCVNTIAFNLDRNLFRDLRLRRAIGQAIDRSAFVERIEFGSGRAATTPISSRLAVARADDLRYPAFDTLEARRLLDSLGWRAGRDGIRVARGVAGIREGRPLAFTFTHMSSLQAYGELLRAQLRVVGIELTLQSLEPAVFADVLFRRRAFDTGIISYCHGVDPEIGVRRMYVSSSVGPVPFSNAAGYREPEMDRLFDVARQTPEVSERRRAYRAIQELAIRDLPYLPLVESATIRAFRTRCTGLRGGPHFAALARCGP